MNRKLTVLGLALFLTTVFCNAALASCKRCSSPPPHTSWVCGDTFYNWATGCVITSLSCTEGGQCQGELGECRARDGCVFEKWACGAPLGDDWRLDTIEVKVAAVEQMRLEEESTGAAL